MSNDLAIYDLVNSLNNASRDVCEGLRANADRPADHILDRAIATCCKPATYEDGTRVASNLASGYVVERVISLALADGHVVKAGVGDELMVCGGVVRILSLHNCIEHDIVLGQVASVAFAPTPGTRHLW